jgi:hypothetical protein
MAKIQLYATTFILSLAGYLAFNTNSIADTAVFAAFLVSSLLYVFAAEELPKEKDIEIPEVHRYHSDRINHYGHTMSVSLVIAALLYYVGVYVFLFRGGIIALVLWGLILLTSYFSARIFNETSEITKTIDYISLKSRNRKEEISKVIGLIHHYEANGNTKQDIKYKIESNFSDIDAELLHSTLELYFEYKKAFSNKLTPAEIRELNRKTKV